MSDQRLVGLVRSALGAGDYTKALNRTGGIDHPDLRESARRMILSQLFRQYDMAIFEASGHVQFVKDVETGMAVLRGQRHVTIGPKPLNLPKRGRRAIRSFPSKPDWPHGEREAEVIWVENREVGDCVLPVSVGIRYDSGITARLTMSRFFRGEPSWHTKGSPIDSFEFLR